MKKYCLLFVLFLAAFFPSHAQVAYLVHTPYDQIPDYGGEQPEKQVYDWFNSQFVSQGKGQFVTYDQLSSDIKVLWVNVERNISEADFDNLFPSNVRTAIADFVKNGGNLLLTKKACRLACHIGRMGNMDNSTTYYPSWSNTGYSVGGDTWTINAMIGVDVTLRDARMHPVFDGMQKDNYNNYAHESFPMIGTVNRSDDNCIWTEMERKDGNPRAGNDDLNHLKEFESAWGCQVLAVWGHVRNYCAPVMVEFYPQGNFKGTVMTIGSNAYQWGTSNDYIANVKKLTENTLNYLNHKGVEYGYVMPYSLSEIYSIEEYRPDYQAAKWFYDNYILTDKGRFIHKDEAIPSAMKVLWVNNDRVGQGRDDYFNALGGNSFKSKLEDFVKAGGNVFLSKQATRWVNDINRCTWQPGYNDGGYATDASDVWYMTSNFVACGSTDRHEHAIFRHMQEYTEHSGEGYCKWPLLSATATPYSRTDHNCLWDDFGAYGISAGSTAVERLNSFESGQNCTVLGGFGHTTALDAVGLVEFKPNGAYNGTVIAIGLAAYQWTTVNASINNVQNLTNGILEYLSPEELYERDVRSGYFGTICLPKASTRFEGADMYEIAELTADGRGIELDPVTSMQAGKPYLFLATAATLRVYMTGAENSAVENKGLVGNLGASNMDVPLDAWILKDNQLYIVDSDNVKIAQNRAYINPAGIPASGTSSPRNGRRSIGIHNTPTACETVSVDSHNPTKVLNNGVLYIIRDGKTYNAQGQCIR